MVKGWFADLVEDLKNIKGLHVIIASLLPDPEDPQVDRILLRFDEDLKKIVETEKSRFTFLHLK